MSYKESQAILALSTSCLFRLFGCSTRSLNPGELKVCVEHILQDVICVVPLDDRARKYPLSAWTALSITHVHARFPGVVPGAREPVSKEGARGGVGRYDGDVIEVISADETAGRGDEGLHYHGDVPELSCECVEQKVRQNITHCTTDGQI